MSFYVVTNPDTGNDVWLAWEDTAEVRIYAYSPNLGAFVRHNSLAEDFYRDMELQYRPIDVDEAVRIVAEGRLGKLDARTHQREVLDWLKSIQDRKDPAELLAGSQLRPATLSPRQAAKARAAKVAAAPPGQWVTWKSYASERRQLSYVAVNDIRTGKVKGLAELGVEVRNVQDERGQYLVQVRRPAKSGPASEVG